MKTANPTHWWSNPWLLAIAMIALWLSLKPDWGFMRESVWAWPAVEFVHVMSLIGFFGLRTMIDLRLTNKAFSGVPIQNLLQKFMPATVGFAAVTIASGMALYSTTPDSMSARPMFQLKVVVLVLALLNLFYLHRFALPAIEKREAEAVLPLNARISALLSMCLWAVVIVAALLIPYIT